MTMSAGHDAAPLRFGPYVVASFLSSGGMGSVYTAVHQSSGARVALKTASTSSPRFVAALQREVHALAVLRHPGVVQVLGSGVEQGTAWYAMELVTGRTLNDHLKGRFGALSTDVDVTTVDGGIAPAAASHTVEAEAVASAERIIAGAGDLETLMPVALRLHAVLEFVHSHGVVHRDLKPDNVILREGLAPVLIDFGIAQRLGVHERLESHELDGGTVQYMSPEQINLELVDARSDMYAFGCILHELIAGRPPFTGQRHSVMMRHALVQPARVSSLVRGIGRELDELVAQLLSKTARARVAAFERVPAVLGNILGGGTTTTTTTTAAAPRRLWRPAFAGRAQARAALNEALARPCVVALQGEAGAGKTRLLVEISRGRSDVQVALGAGRTHSATTAAPLQALRGLLRLCSEMQRAWQEAPELLEARRTLAPFEPALAEVPQEPSAAPSTVDVGQRRVRRALLTLVRALAKDQPLAILVDDADTIDETSLAVLEDLEEEIGSGLPASVVVACRAGNVPRRLARWLARPSVVHLSLDPLDRTAIGGLVADVVGVVDADGALVDHVVAAARDSPFLAAEVVRDLVAQGLLVVDDVDVGDETRRVARLSHSTAIPSASELILRRVAGLSTDAGKVAIAAALVAAGTGVVDLALLEGIVQMPRDAFFQALDELISAQVVDEAEPGLLRFASGEHRTALAAHASSSLHDAVHRATATALEAGGAVDVFALAFHWLEAGDASRAYDACARAARNALAQHAAEQALALGKRALELLDEGRTTRPPLERASLESCLGAAAYGLGDLIRTQHHHERVLALLGDAVPTGKVSTAALGLQGLAYAALSPSSSSKPRDPALAMRARAWLDLLDCFFYQQDFPRGIYCGLRGLRLARALPPCAEAARGYAMIGYTIDLVGLNDLACTWCTRAVEMARALNDPAAIAYACSRAAVRAMHHAQWGQLDAMLREGVDVAAAGDARRGFEECTAIGGLASFYRGHVERGAGAWRDVCESAVARDDPQTTLWARLALIEADLRLGSIAKVRRALKVLRPTLGSHTPRTEILMEGGMRAFAAALDGDDDDAAAASQETLLITGAGESLAYWTHFALTGVFAAAVQSLGRAPQDPARAKLASRTRAVAEGFVKVVPLFMPFFAVYDGVHLHLRGRHDDGVSRIRAAVAEARRLGLPFETALGVWQLRRLGAGSAADVDAAFAAYGAADFAAFVRSR